MSEHDSPILAQRLAGRVQRSRRNISPVGFADELPSDEMLSYLREHLAGGETHYTTRPGMVELREEIGRYLGELGGPEYDSDGVVITAGEGEALFVTLLGIGIGTAAHVVARTQCRHGELFELMGVRLVGSSDPAAAAASAVYEETGAGGSAPGRAENAAPVNDHDHQRILAIGELLFSERSSRAPTVVPSETAIVIGHLDALPGIDRFRVGFAAGPPAIVKRIMTWKQALSICSPAPSQRAALFAIANREQS